MNFSFKVPSISKKREEFNFDHSHTMTHNFGVSQVVSCIDVKPNDDITIDLSAFTRLMPMPCPSYGGVKLTHRAFFVPINYVIRHFEDFIAMQKSPFYSNGGNSNLDRINIPYFTPKEVLFRFLGTKNYTFPAETEYFVNAPAGATEYDFLLYDSGWKKLNYTTKGRRIVSWLAQLGYKLPSSLDGQGYSEIKYDCTALFAWWKFYLDWVVPSRFVLSVPDFVYVRGVLENSENTYADVHLSFDPNGTPDGLIDIVPFLNVPTSFLDDDIYTSAFQSPYGVENSTSELPVVDSLLVQDENPAGQLLPSPQNFGDDRPSKSAVVNAYRQINPTGDRGFINQLSLLSLGRLQQLINTKKITSTSVLDWLRSNYGISPSKEALHISEYLGSFDSQIMIGDVMATATTDSQLGTTVVGQYAGKGLGGSSGKWRIRSNSFGYVFITAEISTKSSYVNGVSPLRMRFKPLDFYNEKFDNVGVRAIPHSELIYNTFETPIQSVVENLPSPNGIFGFSPRYSEYKYKNDMVSGDFMFPSVNKGLDSWYLSRKFKLSDNPTIGLEFLSATSDSVGSQYDRIFQNTDNIDHFYSIYRINVHATSLMEKLYDYFHTLNETSEDKDSLDVNIN